MRGKCKNAIEILVRMTAGMATRTRKAACAMRAAGAMIAIVFVMGLSGCDKDRMAEAFVESGEIRLQMGGNVQFRYEPMSCQMSFNSGTLEFMAFDDSMSNYYSVTLSEIPTAPGQHISADLTWTTSTDVHTRNNIAFETRRLEGDKIWLWSNAARIGVSLRVLQ